MLTRRACTVNCVKNYALWQLLLYFYREFSSKILFVYYLVGSKEVIHLPIQILYAFRIHNHFFFLKVDFLSPKIKTSLGTKKSRVRGDDS